MKIPSVKLGKCCLVLLGKNESFQALDTEGLA